MRSPPSNREMMANTFTTTIEELNILLTVTKVTDSNWVFIYDTPRLRDATECEEI